ncbi:MAG: adenylate/guanylate cyclase domain-containing protein, partial [Pseudomonadota bacterium]
FAEARVWLPLAVPVFVTSILLCLGALAARYAFARAMVGRLVPKPVAATLMGGTSAERRAAWSEDATIMFTDLVGSTAMSEQMSQLEFTDATNVYYDNVTDLVEGHDGMVVEFQGDGIVAMFTESVAGEAHAEKACRAALALARQLDDRNAEAPDAAPLRIRIGLHSGLTATGDIGARQRFTFKALGETVILAARLEQHGKELKTGDENIILLSGATRAGAPGLHGEFDAVGPVELRGRSAPIDVYRMHL